MWQCIAGLLMCGTAANHQIPGPVAYAPSTSPNYAWRYAAYYSPAVLSAQRIAIPAYANTLPAVVVPSIDAPGAIAPVVVARRY